MFVAVDPIWCLCFSTLSFHTSSHPLSLPPLLTLPFLAFCACPLTFRTLSGHCSEFLLPFQMTSASTSTTWEIRSQRLPTFRWGGGDNVPSHHCHYCHIPLLTGESPGFCCGVRGSRLCDVPPLPPLPVEYHIFLNHPHISSRSCIFILIFTFASMECTTQFPSFQGLPAFFAVHGRLYHRVRPTHENSAVHWILYDGFLAHRAPHKNLMELLPPEWINAFTDCLLRLNPLVCTLQQLSLVEPSLYPNACLILEDRGTSPEVSVYFTAVIRRWWNTFLRLLPLCHSTTLYPLRCLVVAWSFVA